MNKQGSSRIIRILLRESMKDLTHHVNSESSTTRLPGCPQTPTRVEAEPQPRPEQSPPKLRKTGWRYPTSEGSSRTKTAGPRANEQSPRNAGTRPTSPVKAPKRPRRQVGF